MGILKGFPFFLVHGLEISNDHCWGRKQAEADEGSYDPIRLVFFLLGGMNYWGWRFFGIDHTVVI